MSAHGWQPIETAPRDGTRFHGAVGDDIIAMFWHPQFEAFVSSFRRMTLTPGLSFEDGSRHSDHSPTTHAPRAWRPLDLPPEAP